MSNLSDNLILSYKLPYHGNISSALRINDDNGAREIIKYRESKSIYLSLPRVDIRKDKCELKISFLTVDGRVDRSICVIRNKIKLGNEVLIRGLAVYLWEDFYYLDIDVLEKSDDIIAIPISSDIYYLIDNVEYKRDKVEVYYNLYARLYWNKLGISSNISYEEFTRFSIEQMINRIMVLYS